MTKSVTDFITPVLQDCKQSLALQTCLQIIRLSILAFDFHDRLVHCIDPWHPYLSTSTMFTYNSLTKVIQLIGNISTSNLDAGAFSCNKESSSKAFSNKVFSRGACISGVFNSEKSSETEETHYGSLSKRESKRAIRKQTYLRDYLA
jgi:hypothetical protein